MFNRSSIIYIYIAIFLLITGCKESVSVDDSISIDKSTLGNPDLTGAPLDKYFYDFTEDIDAHFLYYSLPYYDGMAYNTMQSPDKIELDRDTLNFRTFPDYLLGISKNFINVDTRLYPLNEGDPTAENWCAEILLQYNGNCPSKVDFNDDGKKSSSGAHLNLEVKKDTTFIISWEDIDSLIWLSDKDRYDVVLQNPSKGDTFTVSFDSLAVPDTYDSLIYIGIIDTNRVEVDDLLFIDRSEWQRFDTTYRQSDYSIVLDHTFNYQQVKISSDSLMFRVNSDCNLNGVLDSAEEYFDYGLDWCPDSLETGDGFCIADGAPCNCLGNWIVGDVLEVNADWEIAKANDYHLDPLWMYGEHWRSLDPNGDRWRDCGCDGLCYSDSNWTGADPGESEGNQITDCDEYIEGNQNYDYDFQRLSGEYYIDRGNDIVDEAEFCSGSISGSECVGEFEDRNCNGKWDAAEIESNKTVGNGIRDSEEIWNDDNGDNVVQANEIYSISEKMEAYLVNYPEVGNPVPMTGLNVSDTIRVKYLSGANAFYVTYDSLIQVVDISKYLSASFRPIDSIKTIFSNKVIESDLTGQSDDYFITKASWHEPVNDIFGTRNYEYDYHIFNSDISNGKIVKRIHPEYFKHYGYETDLKNFDESFYVDPAIVDEIYLYTYNNTLRNGEYHFNEDTVLTAIGNYYISDEYSVEFDDSVSVSIRRNLYDESLCSTSSCVAPSDSISCYADPSLSVSKISDCPLDSIITNSYKITRIKTFVLLGNGVEFGFKNTFWLGHDHVNNKPLGVIKDKIEYRWTEAPWEAYGLGWKEYSRLELRSLRTPDTILPRSIFDPINKVVASELKEDPKFDFDPFRFSSSYGIHRIRQYHGE